MSKAGRDEGKWSSSVFGMDSVPEEKLRKKVIKQNDAGIGGLFGKEKAEY